MIEIDHHSLLNAAEPAPEPARPILASRLLVLEEKQRLRFVGRGDAGRIKTGCAEIDELLGGGFERGIMVGISAEGSEGRLISLHLLASILISCLRSHSITPQKGSSTKVVVIDTMGSFPLPLLARILKSRLFAANTLSARTANQTANYNITGKEYSESSTAQDIERDVHRCLEMVAISRVFDIEGLWEVLGEVRISEESGLAHDTSRNSSEGKANSEDLATGKTGNDQSPKAREILDSEEEVSSLDEESTPAPEPAGQKLVAMDDAGTEAIIVDNMTHIINELFARKEKGDAHTLLSLLSQTLHTLAQTHNILTILHNTTAPAKSNYSPAAPPHDSNQQGPSKRTNQLPAPKSIFHSNPNKPSLGQIFAQFPSLHLLLSSLPKTRENAELLYGQDEGSGPFDTSDIRYCTVLEVLKDETPVLGEDKQKGRKFGWREQRWTALDVTSDGAAFVGAFQVKGNTSGMGLERQTVGGLTDVGVVAKIYGFGGRRV